MLQVGLWSPVIRTENDPILFTDSGNNVTINYTIIGYGESHNGGGIPLSNGNLTVEPLNMDGPLTPQSGTTTNRPTTVVQGYQYFDTDLGHPIWWNGSNWVNASGSNV